MFATAIVVILSGVVVTSVIIVDGLHFIVMMPVMLATGIDGLLKPHFVLGFDRLHPRPHRCAGYD